MLPPGAFILLGCMIAWKNWIEARAAARQEKFAVKVIATGN
jgi:electron transport complex protein RnfE